MNGPEIAVVGLACRYPDANSPRELWETVLHQRRAFRRLPPERLNPADYHSADRSHTDATYATHAAVLENYEFDRVRFRVSGTQYRSADPAHWLALDVAAEALADAGFADGTGLDTSLAGVLLGNTLTGEFSRANTLRLRWPYVRRVVEAGLKDTAWSAAERAAFLETLEREFKAPFAPMTEETLAGGLSNTIAGRICNVFDFKGGGYTVDGACSASLLAVTHACNHLIQGDLDVALAGGVDLSLDPFELVGFARVGAIAPGEMRVYDARSAGFWPGEGCGLAVLMRAEDARAQGRRVYAVIRGWGVSSDGSGGITRPEVEGQLLALRRAYARAGFGAESVGYFEGHGTGTEVGDATELRVLATAHGSGADPAVVGSIKANIGHTKAAAGVAGFLKAVLSLHHRTLPPTTASETPHPVLQEPGTRLRVTRRAEAWTGSGPRRAGVSAMGFGGINAHVVLEEAGPAPADSSVPPALPPDVELFLFAGTSGDDVKAQLEALLPEAARLSRAELTDLSVSLLRELKPGPFRAGFAASTPEEFAAHLEALASETEPAVEPATHRFLGRAAASPRVGFLFTGQGAPANLAGGIWPHVFPRMATQWRDAALPTHGDGVATEVAQPAICTWSLAGVEQLSRAGVEASVAVGHSLGELSALTWAGAFSPEALLHLARVRGRAMADLGDATGAMAGLSAGTGRVRDLLKASQAVLAGDNGPERTVISGPADAVEQVLERARSAGIAGARLSVSHAFHSPLVAAAEAPLRAHLADHPPGPLTREVASTITGAVLRAEDDLPGLLCRQVTQPVRFREAILAAGPVDLWVEVGPGAVLARLTRENTPVPVVALDLGSRSVRGLYDALAAAFVAGCPLNLPALTEHRFARPFDRSRPRRFLVNPCELAPQSDSGAVHAAAPLTEASGQAAVITGKTPLELVRSLVAARAELPADAVRDGDRLLGDLNLNSIVVGQLVAEACRHLDFPAPTAPTEFSTATVAELAQALEQLAEHGEAAPPDRAPAPAEAWVRTFITSWREEPVPEAVPAAAHESWQVFGLDAVPEDLAAAVASWPGSGVLLSLPRTPRSGEEAVLLDAAKAAVAARGSRLVVWQPEAGGSSLARTFHLETGRPALVVTGTPASVAAARIAEELASLAGFREVRFSEAGVRQVPVLETWRPTGEPEPLTARDTVLVSGGGKGIAAEIALCLARDTGAALILLGRSEPGSDPVLAQNLERFAAQGIRVAYRAADVRNATEVAAAVCSAIEVVGPVTAVLHGAGRNEPRLIADLQEDAAAGTFAVKRAGLANLIAAVRPERLRCVAALGSIIARTGLSGEADYGAANECLRWDLNRLSEHHPHLRTVTLESSVWSGAGMGERLGRLESLGRQGIGAIPVETGVAACLELLSHSTPDSVALTGRLGALPTVAYAPRELPLFRFLERPRIHVPEVELTADFTLSPDTDPYLLDHVFHGERVFPGVLGLEAMAQAVQGLTGKAPAAFRSVRFHRPLVVGDALEARVSVVQRDATTCFAVLRAASTGFGVDHFEAVISLEPEASEPRAASPSAVSAPALEQADALYEGFFFHSGRFRRIGVYQALEATSCTAAFAGNGSGSWFARYLPSDFVLGDPSRRDAAIHAVQACIPHARLLPVSVARIARVQDGVIAGVTARERGRRGDRFTYDLELHDAAGHAVEVWEGLELKVLEPMAPAPSWPLPLLGPYIQRRVEELTACRGLRVAVEPGEARESRRHRVLARLLGPDPVEVRRPDGKPEFAGSEVSLAHNGSVTFAVASDRPLGCDVEAAEPETWRQLLGEERAALAAHVAETIGETPLLAAGRIWGALEGLKKAGAAPDEPLRLGEVTADGWVLFHAGARVVATYVHARQDKRPLRFAVCVPAENGAR